MHQSANSTGQSAHGGHLHIGGNQKLLTICKKQCYVKLVSDNLHIISNGLPCAHSKILFAHSMQLHIGGTCVFPNMACANFLLWLAIVFT